MKIETKFSIGDNVFYLDKEKMQAREGKIWSLVVSIATAIEANGEPRKKITYMVDESTYSSLEENEIFATKQELIDYISR